MRAALVLLLLSGSSAGAEDAVLKEEITIKGKRAPGPAAWAPPPVVDKPVLDEVIGSLKLMRADHRGEAPKIPLPVLRDRLARPFPTPPYLVFSPRSLKRKCDSWAFQVFEGKKSCWSSQGEGKLPKRLEWDGRDHSGRMLARVGAAFHFRFSCRDDKETLSLESEPVPLASLRYQENMGDIVLEAGLPLIFVPGRTAFAEGGEGILQTMADWMARKGGKNAAFRFDLHEERPDSPPAKKRVEALAAYLSNYLVIHPDRISVKAWTAGERGAILSCSLSSASDTVIKFE